MGAGATERFVLGEPNLTAAKLNTVDQGGNVFQKLGIDNELNVEVSAMPVLDETGANPVAVVFPAVALQAVTANQTNFLFLVSAAPAAPTLSINQTGFPDPQTTEHIPLAEVVASSSAITSFADKRPAARLGVGRLASYSVANLPVLTTGFAHAFATDARKTGEGGGSGTGIMAVFDVASGWRDANGAALLT